MSTTRPLTLESKLKKIQLALYSLLKKISCTINVSKLMQPEIDSDKIVFKFIDFNKKILIPLIAKISCLELNEAEREKITPEDLNCFLFLIPFAQANLALLAAVIDKNCNLEPISTEKIRHLTKNMEKAFLDFQVFKVSSHYLSDEEITKLKQGVEEISSLMNTMIGYNREKTQPTVELTKIKPATKHPGLWQAVSEKPAEEDEPCIPSQWSSRDVQSLI